MKKIDDIEPIHELPHDEIEHILNITRDNLQFLWDHKNTNPEESRGIIEQQVNYNLQFLIHSIKKSLLYFYPKRKKELSEVVDANEAWWCLNIMKESGTRSYPLYEGIEALLKIYNQLGPHYPCDPNDPEGLSLAKSDFAEMERTVKDYAMIAAQYFHEDKMKEAEPDVKTAKTYKDGQQKKRGLRRTWGGLTQEEIKERNQRIIDKFKNSKLKNSRLTPNSFANTNKYQDEFQLKPSQIRTIFRNANIK